MENKKLYKIIYWIFFVAAIITFWVSLRTDIHEVEYTFMAVGLWAVAFFVNRTFLHKKK